jgi:PKD repeat protein
VGETATFDAGFSQGSNPLTGYDWDFGDGETGIGMGVDHIYQTAGDYPVTLTVTDENGLQDIDTMVLRVNNVPTPVPPSPTPEPPEVTVTPPPTATPVITSTPVLTLSILAVISGTNQAAVGQPVAFSGELSQSSSSIISYNWDLGDGGLAFGMGTVHTYTVAGLYTVTLTIADTQGLMNSATHTIQINTPSP